MRFLKFFCSDGELSTESSFDGVQHQGGGLRGLQVREQELPRGNRIYSQTLRSVLCYLYQMVTKNMLRAYDGK